MEWKEVRLGDVCTRVCSGGTPKSTNLSYYGGEIPWLNTKEIDFNRIYSTEKTITDSGLNNSSAKWIVPNTVTVAMYGATAGKSCIVKVPMTTNQACCNLTINDEVADYEFVYYTLKNDYTTLASLANGGAQQNLNAQIIKDYVLKMPSLADQRRIASILSSLDRKIELNNKINADLEEMAQAIFKNWFVDFEPFKDGKFVDSELGMIPEGWKVISLNEILDNVSGYSYKGSELQSSNIAMATIKNFERKGGFKTEGYKEIVISKKIKETQFVNMFDVLVAHTDLTQNAEIVGNPAIVLSKGGYEKLIMSMDLTKVISKIDGVTNGLLYCILSTSRFKEHALGYVNGTTVLHMSKKAVPEYTCAFPKDINQIRDLCITLDSIYKRMAVTYDENSRLSLLRDTLLPRLMSGELEVPE